MQSKKSLTSIMAILLFVSIGTDALAATIGSLHGTQCQAVTPSNNIQNSVWGIENLGSSVAKVSCAVPLTGNLDNSSTRGGLAPFKVTVTTQDWNAANKCTARLRNDNGSGKDNFAAVTNTKTGSYVSFDIVDEYVAYLDTKGKFMVIECNLHGKVANKNPPAIRAIKVTN